MYQADEKRYETMQYNRCGNSGLLLPELSLGSVAQFWNTLQITKYESTVFYCI